MRKMTRISKSLSLVAGLALTLAGALAAANAAEMPAKDMPAKDKDMPAAGAGATFVNSSNHHVTVYTRFGAEGDCAGQPKEQVVNLDAKQTVSVDSGGSNVCFCTRVPDGNACASGWITVKAGGTKHLA
jgi:hypothetical protein